MDWLLILQGYINSEQALRNMEAERASERDLILTGVYPQYEVLGGIPRRFGYSTEIAALELIYLDDTYSSVRERHTGNRELLIKAMSYLSTKEIQAFNHIVWEQLSDMTTEELKRYEKLALDKICLFINSHKVMEFKTEKYQPLPIGV